MDFRKMRETDDLPPATPDDAGLIPIDFAHLVDALERAQRQSAAAAAEEAAAGRARSSITDNALKGLEAMTPRIAPMPGPHRPANFHDRVAEVVRTANRDQADGQHDAEDPAKEDNASVTESSPE